MSARVKVADLKAAVGHKVTVRCGDVIFGAEGRTHLESVVRGRVVLRTDRGHTRVIRPAAVSMLVVGDVVDID